MKRFTAAILAVAICLCVFCACGGDAEEEKVYDVKEIVDTIVKDNPVTRPAEVNDEYMEYLDIDRDMYDEYAGYYCPINPGNDLVIAIKAKSDKVEDVKSRLERQRDALGRNSDLYPGESEKAAAGRIVVKGNYVVLAIVGDMNVLNDEGVEKMYEPVDKAIDEAFK